MLSPVSNKRTHKEGSGEAWGEKGQEQREREQRSKEQRARAEIKIFKPLIMVAYL